MGEEDGETENEKESEKMDVKMKNESEHSKILHVCACLSE